MYPELIIKRKGRFRIRSSYTKSCRRCNTIFKTTGKFCRICKKCFNGKGLSPALT